MATVRAKAPRVFVADDKFSDVIEELTRRGWRRFPHLSFPKFDLKWSNYSKIAWRRVAPTQLVNHLEHATLFSRKDTLAQRLHRLPPSSKVDGFFLKTFDLSDASDRQRLRVHYQYARAVGVLKSALAGDAMASSSDTRLCASCTALITSAATALEGVIAAGDTLEGWKTIATTDLATHRLCDGASCFVPSDERERLQRILDALRRWDAQLEAVEAGHGDVWICKPSNLSQGRGIHLRTSLEDIFALCQRHETAHESTDALSGRDEDANATRWIVQKYLERPLLLPAQRHRKFDIRQWVLITSLSPLKVYWYSSCYLRFCSAPFTLQPQQRPEDDAWTHLSNYSIQQHAPTAADVEEDAMWTSARFQQELQREFHRDVWNESLVPQMQHAALSAIRSVLPELSMVGRGFEWLGIDFLVDASLCVWLLEVNVSPDVSHSTRVTSVMVPPATRDALDLVLGETTSRTETNGWRLLL